MKTYKSIINLSILAACTMVSLAEAKVAEFTNAEAVVHVLTSSELRKEVQTNVDLKGLNLASVDVVQSGGPGIGTKYTLTLQYSNLPRVVGVPANCVVEVTTENVKDTKAPNGIIASLLSAPRVDTPNCSQ